MKHIIAILDAQAWNPNKISSNQNKYNSFETDAKLDQCAAVPDKIDTTKIMADNKESMSVSLISYCIWIHIKSPFQNDYIHWNYFFYIFKEDQSIVHDQKWQ